MGRLVGLFVFLAFGSAKNLCGDFVGNVEPYCKELFRFLVGIFLPFESSQCYSL